MPCERTSETSRRAWLNTTTPAGLSGLLAAKASAAPALPAAPPRLKITDVKAYRLKTGQIFVEVFTDGGVTGMGECSPTVNTVALAAIIENQSTAARYHFWVSEPMCPIPDKPGLGVEIDRKVLKELMA